MIQLETWINFNVKIVKISIFIFWLVQAFSYLILALKAKPYYNEIKIRIKTGITRGRHLLNIPVNKIRHEPYESSIESKDLIDFLYDTYKTNLVAFILSAFAALVSGLTFLFT